MLRPVVRRNWRETMRHLGAAPYIRGVSAAQAVLATTSRQDHISFTVYVNPVIILTTATNTPVTA